MFSSTLQLSTLFDYKSNLIGTFFFSGTAHCYLKNEPFDEFLCDTLYNVDIH